LGSLAGAMHEGSWASLSDPKISLTAVSVFGPRSRITSAHEAVEMAVRFVAAVTALIEP
jgi:hypothetical protein